MEFVRIDRKNMLLYAAWFVTEQDSRWVSRPTETWLNYVTRTPEVHAWLAYENGLLVGHVQCDIKNNSGFIDLVVNPSLRNMGNGTRVLKEVMHLCEMAELDKVIANIEPNNIGSIRCFTKAGYVSTANKPDDEGFLQYEYRPSLAARSEVPLTR